MITEFNLSRWGEDEDGDDGEEEDGNNAFDDEDVVKKEVDIKVEEKNKSLKDTIDEMDLEKVKITIKSFSDTNVLVKEKGDKMMSVMNNSKGCYGESNEYCQPNRKLKLKSLSYPTFDNNHLIEEETGKNDVEKENLPVIVNNIISSQRLVNDDEENEGGDEDEDEEKKNTEIKALNDEEDDDNDELNDKKHVSGIMKMYYHSTSEIHERSDDDIGLRKTSSNQRWRRRRRIRGVTENDDSISGKEGDGSSRSKLFSSLYAVSSLPNLMISLSPVPPNDEEIKLDHSNSHQGNGGEEPTENLNNINMMPSASASLFFDYSKEDIKVNPVPPSEPLNEYEELGNELRRRRFRK